MIQHSNQDHMHIEEMLNHHKNLIRRAGIFTMKDKKITQLVVASMFAALCCVATMSIRVPTFGTNGYVNIGDTIVLLSAWLLGGAYGALAAGIGSGLADLLSGYTHYVPATFTIKFLMALVAFLLFSHLSKKLPKTAAYVISAIVAELIMMFGYFFYQSTILGYGLAAATSISGNIIQGSTCSVLALACVTALNLAKVPNLLKLV